MHLFHFRKERIYVVHVERDKEQTSRYDVSGAFAKAVFVFLFMHGVIGGFLSAYGIEYNKGFCMGVLFLVAFFLAAVYQTKKRWMSNLANVALLAVYMYIAANSFWTVNNGYYVILNRIYEAARSYFNVTTGIEYLLVVEDEYSAVTGFVIFFGMMGTITLNILTQYRVRIFGLLIAVLALFSVPFYFGKTPDTVYVFFLLIAFVTMAVINGGGAWDDISGQIKYILPAAVILVFTVAGLMMIVVPERKYNAAIPENKVKKATENNVAWVAQYGLIGLMGRGKASAGVSKGMLSNSMVMPAYCTDLIVRYTPYSNSPVYLKAFTGKDYEGDRWSEAQGIGNEDSVMAAAVEARKALHESDPGLQGKGIMEIQIVRNAKGYMLKPYYEDYTAFVMNSDDGVYGVYTYYPPVGDVKMAVEEVDAAYYVVPKRCLAAVKKVCADGGFSGTKEEIVGQVMDYFSKNYSYTLRPGMILGNYDYITYFLIKNKKGYCAHFASAATMVFRYMGIAARYVEGYAFSYSNVVTDAALIEDAAYEDYYDGYSLLGKTGLVELEVLDSQAHAWVEVYIDGKGWIAVDPTPSSGTDEDMSFWEAFLEGGSSGGRTNFGGNVGEFIESAADSVAVIVFVVAAVVAVLVTIKRINRRRMVLALPVGEQIKYEYKNMTSYLAGKYADFASLGTIDDQTSWIEEYFGIVFDAQERKELYEIFFASQTDNCDGTLRDKIVKARKNMRMSRRMRMQKNGNVQAHKNAQAQKNTQAHKNAHVKNGE